MKGTGLIAELGDQGPVVALRADLDALPVDDPPVRPGPAGRRASPMPAGTTCTPPDWWEPRIALAETHGRGLLPGRARLLFQPAEEVMPGGALRLMEAGALDEVVRIFALHCDPTHRRRPGRAPRGSADRCRRRPRRPVDGTRRAHLPPAPDRGPHLRARQGLTELPAILSRRLDPRAGVSVVWGCPRRVGAQRHPRGRPGRRHGPDARRGRLGRRRKLVPD